MHPFVKNAAAILGVVVGTVLGLALAYWLVYGHVPSAPKIPRITEPSAITSPGGYQAPSAGDEEQMSGPEGRGPAGPPRGTVVSAPPEGIKTFQHAEGPSHCAGRGGTYVKSARHPGNGRVIHNCSY